VLSARTVGIGKPAGPLEWSLNVGLLIKRYALARL
jgi:hypothetical protein